MKASAWERRFLVDLVDAGDSNTLVPRVVVVAENSEKFIHLWRLLQQEFPSQQTFLSEADFRDVVFCDCIADRRMLPPSVETVYVHTKGVRWKRLRKPATAKIKEEA